MSTIYSHYAKPLTRNRPVAYRLGVVSWHVSQHPVARFIEQTARHWGTVWLLTLVIAGVDAFFVSGHAFDAWLNNLMGQPLLPHVSAADASTYGVER